MPNRLSIGAGAAQGASAFVNSFMQARQLKNQEKLQKNAFLIDILREQLKDENLTNFRRAKILDQIPALIGAKTERPLSEIFGLHELEEPQEPAIKGKQGTPARTLTDPNVSNSEMASSLQLKGTQATQDVPASLERKGDLSLALIKKKLLLETNKAADEQDIEKQTKLARINNDIQMEGLKALGFTKEISRGFDADNNYVVTMANAAGQTKKINLGRMTPEAIMKANISSSRPSKSMQALEDYYLTQTNPETGKTFTQEEAFTKALEDTHNSFQLQQKSRQAYIESINQGNTGTKPLSPAQVSDDTRADSNIRLQVQKDVDEAKARTTSALAERDRLGELKTEAGKLAEKADRDFENLRLEITDPEDFRYKAAIKKSEDLREKYNRLEEQYNKANGDYVLANSIYSSATGRLGQIGSGNKYSPEIKNAIDHVRRNNREKTASMSDEEIYNYLKSKGKIK